MFSVNISLELDNNTKSEVNFVEIQKLISNSNYSLNAILTILVYLIYEYILISNMIFCFQLNTYFLENYVIG